MRIRVAIQAEDFDPGAETDALVGGRRDVGAVTAFTGYCRDEGGRLAALELEHYPGMAEDEIRRVAQEAARRWPLLGITAIHRFGKIPPGGRIDLLVRPADPLPDPGEVDELQPHQGSSTMCLIPARM